MVINDMSVKLNPYNDVYSKADASRARLLKRKNRVTYLVVLLLFLFTIYVLEAVPHEPCIYVVNVSDSRISPLKIQSDCSEQKTYELPNNRGIVLHVVPRLGCQYRICDFTLSGEELLSEIEVARSQNADVLIELGYDNISLSILKQIDFSIVN